MALSSLPSGVPGAADGTAARETGAGRMSTAFAARVSMDEAKKVARMAKLAAAGKKFNEKSSPSHSNYVAYLGPNTKRFYQVFSAFGQVINV